jgi:lysophospholipid hydrolase
MEVLTNTKRPSTIHAIRDTEIAIMPSTLFNALSLRHPEITMAIARIIATRSNERRGGRADAMPDIASIGNGPESGNNNVNLKTVAIIPVTGLVPIVEFAERLREAFGLIGASVALLNTASVTSTLGKHAFTRIGRLKLLSWLAEQEESHRLVLYVADGGVNAPWTQRCVRQADCVLLVGLGDEDPGIGEFERLLIGMKTTARKELVLLHAERYCIPGSTSQWLKNRLWIHAHHHVQMRLKTQKMFSTNERKGTFSNLQQHLSQYYPGNPLHARKSSSPNIFGGVRSDFARVARRLLNKSVGLVLGGGGARGLSHIGIIRALEEAGIPIDMVGGTSIGSFVGGLYARENDHVSVFGRGKMFSGQVASKWRQILDLTYPVTSMFTGHAFNRAVWKCFSDTLIEDCWLPYYA